MRAMKRHGRRCDTRKRRQVAIKRKRKIVEESGSFEKFVGGVTIFRTRSCMVLKSSMQFCRSRIFRKKSFDISEAGFMVLGGASGGPFMEYEVPVTIAGGGGCRAR